MKTDEQRSADAALTAAINATIDAYGLRAECDGTPGLTGDYMCIVMLNGFDEDGDITAMGVNLYRDGSMPHYKVLGMVESARHSLHPC